MITVAVLALVILGCPAAAIGLEVLNRRICRRCSREFGMHEIFRRCARADVVPEAPETPSAPEPKPAPVPARSSRRVVVTSVVRPGDAAPLAARPIWVSGTGRHAKAEDPQDDTWVPTVSVTSTGRHAKVDA